MRNKSTTEINETERRRRQNEKITNKKTRMVNGVDELFLSCES